MSRLFLTSDLHLGHKNISKYRTEFKSSEEHHEIMFDNLASAVNKRDTVFFLGDIAFDKYWLDKIKSLNINHKRLVVGNHDTERGITMRDLCDTYDSVVALMAHRGYWLSHCPIHPQEMRGRTGNIHGHLHSKLVEREQESSGHYVIKTDVPDGSYINVCVEHTDWKPILWDDAIKN